jgi:hypothetical protein
MTHRESFACEMVGADFSLRRASVCEDLVKIGAGAGGFSGAESNHNNIGTPHWYGGSI